MDTTNNTATAAPTTRRRNTKSTTRKPAATRGRQATSRRGATAKGNAIPQASAGLHEAGTNGTASVQQIMLSNVSSYSTGIAPSLKSLGLSRAQVISEFQKGLGATGW